MEPRRSLRIAELPAAAAPAPKKQKSEKKGKTDAKCEDAPSLMVSPPKARPLTIDRQVVEVRSGDRPPKHDAKVNWGAAGRAHFHGECWTSVLAAATSRRKVDQQTLSAAERACVKEAASRAEYHDAPADMATKALRFADLLKKAKHAVIFTGAGVSTAAGIGDYRGLTGAWTLQELAPKEDEVIDEGVPYETLRPTYTHEAIAKLMEMDLIKYVISQNCDGLHLLSGVADMKISELHGNVFKEFCVKCHTSHVRNFYVMNDIDESDNCPRCHFNHLTGRNCEVANCKGNLSDTIINFGDLLDKDTLSRAQQNAKDSDLFVSLGSTMLVTPAATLIECASASVICNRQRTKYDTTATVRAFGDCDSLFKSVMQHILGEDEERKWSTTLPTKRVMYDKQRLVYE